MATGPESGGESVLGVDPESTTAVVGVVVISVLLAGVICVRPSRVVLGVAIGFCVAAAVLDVHEVAHQIGEHRGGVALLAVLVTVQPVAAAVAGVLAWRSTARVEPVRAPLAG